MTESKIEEFINGNNYPKITTSGHLTNSHWLLTKEYLERWKIWQRKIAEIGAGRPKLGDTNVLQEMVNIVEHGVFLDFDTMKDYVTEYGTGTYRFIFEKCQQLTLRLMGRDTKENEIYLQKSYVDYLMYLTNGRLKIKAASDNYKMCVLYDGDQWIGLLMMFKVMR